MFNKYLTERERTILLVTSIIVSVGLDILILFLLGFKVIGNANGLVFGIFGFIFMFFIVFICVYLMSALVSYLDID